MMLTETKVSRGGPFAGRSEQRGNNSGANAAKVIALTDGLTNEVLDGTDRMVSGRKRIPVTCRVSEGTRDAEMAFHHTGKVVFVESSRLFPVNTEVTIRLTLSDDVVGDWGGANGTVVWTCPSGDQFSNRRGFGVCLQGRWPLPSGKAETPGPMVNA